MLCATKEGMAGRRSPQDEGGGREQARKVRGFARGHGAHHRHQRGKDAPRQIGSGRDRTEDHGRRQRGLTRLHDDTLNELENSEKKSSVERSVEELGDAHGYGAALEGEISRGRVIEVRKGNFLTRMELASTPQDEASLAAQALQMKAKPAIWKQGDLLKTVVRGTMQQFDLGLSSVVAPGDEIDVVVPPLSGSGQLYQANLHAVLAKVHPRKSEFRRLHPSGRAIQTLGANVDRIFIVASAGQPDFRPGFIDRVLVCAASCNLPAILVVNKMDLGLPERDEALLVVYRGLGLQIFKISLRNPKHPEGDFEALKQALRGARSVFTGHSGVGKSSLLLALNPLLDPAVVRVGEVSGQTQKGKHTTTHARLFTLEEATPAAGGEAGIAAHPATEVVDTPGVREFTPADTDRRNLWGWFPEIARLQGQCAFGDCTHTVERGCAVLEAVKSGAMHPRRHQSYVRIYETLPN